MSWSEGDWVVRREVLSKGPWMGLLVKIVEDNDNYLISYIPEGSPFGFPAGDWPISGGKHPWADRSCWQGPGCLMIQQPGTAHAVWHFWNAPDREFACWYINLQEPFRRTSIGYDTQDLELDLVVYPDDQWVLKDEELLDVRVAEGRWTAARARDIRAIGKQLAASLDLGERWWPLEYRDWQPDPEWVVPDRLPDGWESVWHRPTAPN